jgi:hypothetical protein
MATVQKTITAEDTWTDWLPFRGSGRHEFALDIAGTFSATVTVQIRRSNGDAVIDLEDFTEAAARIGENVGSFDIRAGVKAGNFTSGEINVELND